MKKKNPKDTKDVRRAVSEGGLWATGRGALARVDSRPKTRPFPEPHQAKDEKEKDETRAVT